MTAFEPFPSDSVRPRLLTQWTLLLWGPLVWVVHFFIVYLWTEAVCVTSGPPTEVGSNTTTLLVLSATVIGFVASLWGAVLSFRRWHRNDGHEPVDGFMALIGAMLGIVFALAILFVGLPAIALPPC